MTGRIPSLPVSLFFPPLFLCSQQLSLSFSCQLPIYTFPDELFFLFSDQARRARELRSWYSDGGGGGRLDGKTPGSVAVTSAELLGRWTVPPSPTL